MPPSGCNCRCHSNNRWLPPPDILGDLSGPSTHIHSATLPLMPSAPPLQLMENTSTQWNSRIESTPSPWSSSTLDSAKRTLQSAHPYRQINEHVSTQNGAAYVPVPDSLPPPYTEREVKKRKKRVHSRAKRAFCCMGWIFCCPLWTIGWAVLTPPLDNEDLEEDECYPCFN